MKQRYVEVETPAKIDTRLVCPDCGSVGIVTLEVGSELRIREDDDGEVRELHPVVKKKAIRHHCGQTTMAEMIDDTEKEDAP